MLLWAQTHQAPCTREKHNWKSVLAVTCKWHKRSLLGNDMQTYLQEIK